MWAFLVIGIAILAFQGYKYATGQLEFVVGELIVCIVAAVLIFASKVLSEAFGKLLDKHLGGGLKQSRSVPPTGPKKPPKGE